MEIKPRNQCIRVRAAIGFPSQANIVCASSACSTCRVCILIALGFNLISRWFDDTFSTDSYKIAQKLEDGFMAIFLTADNSMNTI